MKLSKSKQWYLEITWWVISTVIAVIVILPIWSAGVTFRFYIYNIIFVMAGVNLLRYLLFFEHHPYSKSKSFKIAIIFCVPILFFPVLEGLHDFIEYNDHEGLQTGMDHLNHKHKNFLIRYIRIEYLLLGISTMAGLLLLIIKMIRSLWRQVKYQET